MPVRCKVLIFGDPRTKIPTLSSLNVFPGLLPLVPFNCPWVSKDTSQIICYEAISWFNHAATCFNMFLFTLQIINFLSNQIHFTTKRPSCSETYIQINDYMHSLISSQRFNPKNVINVTTWFKHKCYVFIFFWNNTDCFPWHLVCQNNYNTPTSKKELLWKWMGFHFLNDKGVRITFVCFHSSLFLLDWNHFSPWKLWFVVHSSFLLFVFFLTRTCLHCQLKNSFQNWVGSSPQKPKQDSFVSEEKN